jgi:hypothetical protein
MCIACVAGGTHSGSGFLIVPKYLERFVHITSISFSTLILRLFRSNAYDKKHKKRAICALFSFYKGGMRAITPLFSGSGRSFQVSIPSGRSQYISAQDKIADAVVGIFSGSLGRSPNRYEYLP